MCWGVKYICWGVKSKQHINPSCMTLHCLLLLYIWRLRWPGKMSSLSMPLCPLDVNLEKSNWRENMTRSAISNDFCRHSRNVFSIDKENLTWLQAMKDALKITSTQRIVACRELDNLHIIFPWLPTCNGILICNCIQRPYIRSSPWLPTSNGIFICNCIHRWPYARAWLEKTRIVHVRRTYPTRIVQMPPVRMYIDTDIIKVRS